MLKKVISIVCITLLLFSVLSVGFVSSTQADGMSLTGTEFCANPNCGTQTCLVWYIAFCIGDGLSWHSGY